MTAAGLAYVQYIKLIMWGTVQYKTELPYVETSIKNTTFRHCNTHTHTHTQTNKHTYKHTHTHIHNVALLLWKDTKADDFDQGSTTN